MSELNEEWVQSIIKLGLIEAKRAQLANIGVKALSDLTSAWLLESIQDYAKIEALLRDDRATAKLAAEVVKASRK